MFHRMTLAPDRPRLARRAGRHGPAGAIMNTNVQESPSSSNYVCLRNLQEQLRFEIRSNRLSLVASMTGPCQPVHQGANRKVRFFGPFDFSDPGRNWPVGV